MGRISARNGSAGKSRKKARNGSIFLILEKGEFKGNGKKDLKESKKGPGNEVTRDPQKGFGNALMISHSEIGGKEKGEKTNTERLGSRKNEEEIVAGRRVSLLYEKGAPGSRRRPNLKVEYHASQSQYGGRGRNKSFAEC